MNQHMNPTDATAGRAAGLGHPVFCAAGSSEGDKPGAGALSPPLVTRAVPAAVSVTSLNLLFSACDTGLVVANATPRPRGAKEDVFVDMEAPRRAATGTCGEADTDGREEVTAKRAPRDRPHQGGVCTGGPAGKAADDGFLQDVGSCVPCTHHVAPAPYGKLGNGPGGWQRKGHSQQ